MLDQIIETRAQRIWLDEDGILHTEVVPDVDITLADAQEITDAQRQLVGDKRRPLFVDMRHIKSITREAREHYAGEDAQRSVLAVALCVRSQIGKIIGNIFINFNATSLPTRLFSSETEALKWLRGFIK